MTAVHRMETHRPDLFAFEIDGHLSSAEVAEIYASLEAAYAAHDKVDLLVKLTNLDGWDWGAAWSETTWIGKTHALSHIRRYAVVGGPRWISAMVAVFDPLFKVKMKAFSADDETGARIWLDEDLNV